MTDKAKLLVDRILQEAERDAPYTHVSQDILKYGVLAVLKAAEEQAERLAWYWQEEGDSGQAKGWKSLEGKLAALRREYRHLAVE
jgi:hypothetical protein